MKFSVAPLLLVEEDIPLEVRQALVENRLQDAAELLMREYGLSYIEVSNLLGADSLFYPLPPQDCCVPCANYRSKLERTPTKF